MPATMPATIPRLPDVAQIPWKVRWLFNWLLFNKLEAVFLLFESALQDLAGLCRRSALVRHGSYDDAPVAEVD